VVRIVSAIIIGNDWFNDELHYRIFGGHLFLAFGHFPGNKSGLSLFIFNDEWERNDEKRNSKK
jgi:hypothetical protein